MTSQIILSTVQKQTFGLATYEFKRTNTKFDARNARIRTIIIKLIYNNNN